MSTILDEFDQRDWETRRDLEALRTLCWSILLRTLRDLYTYHDCSLKQRKKLYDTAFSWVFEVGPDDKYQPMSFAWVCDILEMDHNQVAKRIWELRGSGFRELKKFLVVVRDDIQ